MEMVVEMKKTNNYSVQVGDHPPVTIYGANSPYHACRKVFRLLIKNGTLKRQPKGDDNGGFQDTVVHVL